jgi:glycosyltransferase involved in cell wall biosynthesis
MERAPVTGSHSSSLRSDGDLVASAAPTAVTEFTAEPRVTPAPAAVGRPDGRGVVLVVAPQPFYEDRGTPIAVLQVVQALSELGYDVDLLTFPTGREPPVDVPGLDVHYAANPLGFRRVPIGLSGRKLVLDVTLAWSLWRLARGRPYHCIHALEEAAFPAIVLGRRLQTPVIYDMQSSIPEQLASRPLFRWSPVARLLTAGERWLVRRASYVVTSGGLAPRVREADPGARVREWRYSSPVREVPAGEAQALRAELGIGPDTPMVVYSGTFEPYQGLPELMAAIPQVLEAHPHTVFVLVGGRHDQAAALAADSSELLRRGSVRILRRQPRERMPAFLAAADVLVSSRAFGANLPLKVFDYLAAGRPIVATDIPAHRAALDASCAILVPPTAASLAEGITRVLSDPVESARLSAAASRYADEHLSWRSFVESVGELYAEVESDRSPAPDR